MAIFISEKPTRNITQNTELFQNLRKLYYTSTVLRKIIYKKKNKIIKKERKEQNPTRFYK